MRRVRREEVQEGEIVNTHWDLRKIGVGLVILVVLVIVGSYFFKFAGNIFSKPSGGVLGASVKTEDIPPLPNKQDIEKAITDARQSLSQITSDNLTSSQAAIQKIIGDLQTLQGKSGALGLVCRLMCKDK